MSSKQQTLGQWAEEWNKLVYFQPDDQLSAKTFDESVLSTAKMLFNHDVMPIKNLGAGIREVRLVEDTTLDDIKTILEWSAPDGIGGSVANLMTFTAKEKVSGKVTRKTCLVTTIVKEEEGQRKIAELIYVEIEI